MKRLKRAILTAAMAGGMLMPSGALARRHVCSGSIERGNMASFMRKSRRSTVVNTPLLEDGKHLRIKLPERYMREVRSASSKRTKPKAFVSAVIQNNVSIALGRLRSARRTRFYCADLKASQPAPRPVVRPSPRPAARRPAPRRPHARPDYGGRGRMIFIDGPGDSAPTYSHPIRPYRNGGAGSRGNPHKIRIPVPSQKRDGTLLFHRVVDARLTTIGLGTLHFDLRFVSKRGVNRVTSKRKLTNSVSWIVEKIISDRLKAAGKQQHASMSGLRKAIGRVVAEAARYPDIKTYAK